MIDLLLKYSKTTYELSASLKLLKSFLESKFFNSPFRTEDLTDREQTLITAIKQEKVLESITKDRLTDFLKELQAETEKINILVIFTAVALNEESTDEVVKKVRLMISNQILVDFRLDPTLVAGCALIWKGVYKDYSLKSRIEQNREQILSQFKSYINTYA